MNTVPLEQYLYGVVPSESPKTWPAEALKAQAVAARSYALAQRKTSGPFDVYPDTRSQVYGGVSAEAPTTTAAVDATAGEVADVRREDRDDVLLLVLGRTHGREQRRLERRADPVSRLRRRPVRHGVAVSQLGAASLHRGQARERAQGFREAARRPDDDRRLAARGTLRAIGSGGERDFTGTDIRTMLGLRSTFFTVGVLSLDPLPPKTLVYGTPFTLTGIGRGLGGPPSSSSGRSGRPAGRRTAPSCRRRRLVLGDRSRPRRPPNTA